MQHPGDVVSVSHFQGRCWFGKNASAPG